MNLISIPLQFLSVGQRTVLDDGRPARYIESVKSKFFGPLSVPQLLEISGGRIDIEQTPL